MTAPQFSFKPEITLGAVFSALLWLGSATWYVSASASDTKELQRTDQRHEMSVSKIEREGSELARFNALRIANLEKRLELMEDLSRKMSDVLIRVDADNRARGNNPSRQ